jgi:predicted ribosome quality control (RQC) complex YloA/Tae2 family protein
VYGCQDLFANTLDNAQEQRSTLTVRNGLLMQLGDRTSTMRTAYEEAKEALETHRSEADMVYATMHEVDPESSSVEESLSSIPIQLANNIETEENGFQDIVTEGNAFEVIYLPRSRRALTQGSTSPSEMSSAGSNLTKGLGLGVRKP